ncbi:MAG: hypothetical protein ACW980_21065 [Promethearchaeota archaeon]|jgi:hypothetical protein
MATNPEDIIKSLRQGLENLKKTALDFEKSTEGVSREQRKGEQDKITALQKSYQLIKDSKDATTEQIEEADKVLKKIEQQNKILKEQYRVTGRITQELSSTGQKYKDFLMTTSAQYNYAQEIAKEYRGLTKSIGLGSKSAEHMTRSFKNALPDVLEMGLKQEDLGRIYQEMADASGRITPVSDADAKAIAGVAAGTGLMASDSANMAESFSLMGVSATKMEEHLMNTYKEAQSMGLNATKVIKVLQTNMRAMQSYSFAGGVKGMTSMAQQAVKMRLDVGDVLQMADKFYQPEAAIEAAANLQMLGGDIADAFGDPFETMYLARNKPEELAKKLGDMTENMMTFNEETGEYEFPAEVRMQLKSGINTDKMIEMARQTSKIKDIKMKFTQIGDMDDAENLASLAEFKDGEYVIKHNGEDLKLDDINEGMAEDIMKANQSSEDTFRDIAVNTQVMSEKLSNFAESQKARVVGTGVDMYELTVKNMEGGLDKLRDGMQATTDEWMKKGKSMVDEMFVSSASGGVLDDTMSEISNLGALLKDSTIKGFDELSEKLNLFGEALDSVEIIGDNKSDEVPIITKDMMSLPGSGGRVLSGEFGSLSLDDRDLIAAGDPKKLMGGGSSGTSSKMEFGTLTINGKIEIVSPDGSSSNIDMSTMKPEIEKMIRNHLNGSFVGGTPTGKQSMNNG